MTLLTHFDKQGNAQMVDVGEKQVTQREAVAEGYISMAHSTVLTIVEGRAGKGDVLGVARIAGIMASKRTAELIPLCHPSAMSNCASSPMSTPTEYAVRRLSALQLKRAWKWKR